MEEASKKAYESVIEEQVAIIQAQKKRLEGYEVWARIANSKSQATKERNRERKLKGKTHYFIKILRTKNQHARRKGIFNQAEKQLLFDVQAFVDYSGTIMNEDYTPMTIKEIADLCNWGKTHTINTINGLVEKGVLSKIQHGKAVNIQMSSDYFKCG